MTRYFSGHLCICKSLLATQNHNDFRCFLEKTDNWGVPLCLAVRLCRLSVGWDTGKLGSPQEEWDRDRWMLCLGNIPSNWMPVQTNYLVIKVVSLPIRLAVTSIDQLNNFAYSPLMMTPSCSWNLVTWREWLLTTALKSKG